MRGLTTSAVLEVVSAPPNSGPQFLGASIKQLRGERKMSQEDVAFAVRSIDPDAKVTAGGVSQIENSKYRPTVEVMEALARVFGVAPEDWLEYRLALARRSLDEREVGAERALANLARLEGV